MDTYTEAAFRDGRDTERAKVAAYLGHRADELWKERQALPPGHPRKDALGLACDELHRARRTVSAGVP